MCDFDCGKCYSCKKDQQEFKQNLEQKDKEKKSLNIKPEKKERKSLKTEFQNIYEEKLYDLLDQQEKAKLIGNDIGRRKIIKEIEELVIEYNDTIKH